MKSFKPLIMATLLAVCSLSVQAQTALDFEPYKHSALRMPSVPLLLNDPYFSIWSPSNTLNGSVTTHWSNAAKPLDGILRVDGTAYRFMGREPETILKPIAPLATEEDWWGRVTHTTPTGNWTATGFDDSNWSYQQAAWGSANEYPAVHNSWTATNSDIYIRRTVSLTAEQIAKELWIEFSHDDVFELYVNGKKIVDTGETWRQGETTKLSDEVKALLKVGDNVIAAHCHNTTGGAYADFGLYENVISKDTKVQYATQTGVSVLATSTYYTFKCGSMDLDLVFTAPMLPNDLDQLSTPINYISYQVKCNDGKDHDVQLYLATTPEMAVNESSQPTLSSVITQNGVSYIKSGTTSQNILGRKGDLICIDWGYLYIPAINGNVSIASAATMEKDFVATGKLTTYGGAISSKNAYSMPTLAYSHDFGTTSKASSFAMIGYDEVYDIQYMQTNYKGYWARNGKTIFKAFEDMRDNYENIMARCRQLDKTIYDDALAVGNEKYAEMLSGTYRHVIAAHKLFQDSDGRLMFFSKENNSNGCVNTVDLTYPSAPLFLLYNPTLLKGMMNSILEYVRTGKWTKSFAPHDLGTYPIANGQVYGGDMPIEETGNMLTLAATLCMTDSSTTWVDPYWGILSRWARYLSNNGQDPGEQLCTDDFAGHWAHNANLSIKAIMGVAGYALMAKIKGDDDTYERYMQKAQAMASIWETSARDGDHYKLAFDRGGTWSQKYNLVWDKLWNTHLFPKQVMKREINYYLTKQNKYGLPLDSRQTYTKADWILWTAAMAPDKETFLKFSDPVYDFVNETNSRVPFSDWYQTISGDMVAFRARSVLGGLWMRILMERMLASAPENPEWALQGNRLKTKWAYMVDPTNPLPEYPRPTMARSDWMNLNGLWDYTVTKTTSPQPSDYSGKILVPFPIESSLSGVMQPLEQDEAIWYKKEFTVPESWSGKQVRLNFGAVDYQATVYLNGRTVTTHKGGYTSFSVDITSRLRTGTNTLVVKVVDPSNDATQPLGKQRYNPGGMGSIWYTTCSGIWQTVWLEPVDEKYVFDLKTTPDVDNNSFTFNIGLNGATANSNLRIQLKDGDEVVAETTTTAQENTVVKLPVSSPKLWSPDSPFLYGVDISYTTDGKVTDHVTSYAALRKIGYQKDQDGYWRLTLNNKPLFQLGLLDQGYWPDGIYTAPTDEALSYDIKMTKELGFNMIRKHMKVEPARWYALCDSLGVLVWQDMPALGPSNMGGWNPTSWWTGSDGSHDASVESAFKTEWTDIINQHYNNPSIVVWTPFNESWGQFKTPEIVELTVATDPTRLVDPASGGNHYKTGDFLDLHDYSRPPSIFLNDPDAPVVLGEYGGLGRHISDHRWLETDATTYVNFDSEKAITDAYQSITSKVMELAKGTTLSNGTKAAFAAAVYTQTTDVETEVNGMMTYDRAVLKLNKDSVRTLNYKLTHLFDTGSTGIATVNDDTKDGKEEYYNMMGMKIPAPTDGIYIVRQRNGQVRKVVRRQR